jgi:quinol monooxygenase YgiN
MIGLSDENDPDRLLAISLWKTKDDADRHRRDHFQRVLDIMGPALQGTPSVQTFNVDSSTAHQIASGKAA